ncbi:MAG: hypothetical protein ACI9RU_001738 [Litorivivens sp.]|jgi:hypothetical protein
MLIKDVIQKVQLVEGQFSPSHAEQVITSLLDTKINFHKLIKLSACIGQHEANTEYTDKRIEELKLEKLVAHELIKEARQNGTNIRINGTLELTFVKVAVPQIAAEQSAG